jgi:hypothetical protein
MAAAIMRIKIKHNTIIFEKESEWQDVRKQIEQDFGQYIFAISWKLKRELGFTVRYHKALIPSEYDHTKCNYRNHIYLDFYNESAHTWFMLKYLNNSKPL